VFLARVRKNSRISRVLQKNEILAPEFSGVSRISGFIATEIPEFWSFRRNILKFKISDYEFFEKKKTLKILFEIVFQFKYLFIFISYKKF